jgi:hypothetical protein
MSWKSIRLELGSTGEFPAGSVSRAYLVRLPLDDEDRVDAGAFDIAPHRAIFRRHWSAEPDERGQVERDGADWVLRHDGKCRTLNLQSLPVRLGQQIRLVDADGDVLPLRVASIR